VEETRVAAIAFCSDSLMEVPLHVAAASVLRYISADTATHFYMLLTDFSEKMRDSLRHTLDSIGRQYRITFLSNEKTKVFQTFRSLLGNYATYYRLLLPEMIEEPVYLYIDSDTLPRIDVAPLFTSDMGSYAAGFVVDGQVKNNLEHEFFISLGRDPEGPTFNAGVMLVQREQWREQDCWNRIKAFCEQYSDKLLTADQTVLNSVLAENCYHLPAEYNIKLYPNRKSPIGNEPGLYHFVGAPKPWDMLGRTLIPYSNIWFDELARIPLPADKKLLWLNSAYWMRAPRILGGYKRLLKDAIKG
jgi:lipopolysaccharide biosynthesis glycosyltransferase